MKTLALLSLIALSSCATQPVPDSPAVEAMKLEIMEAVSDTVAEALQPIPQNEDPYNYLDQPNPVTR